MGLLTAPLSLVRLSLRVAEFGLSTAAEAARIASELLEPDSETSRVEYGSPAQPPVVADAPPAVPDELIPDHVDEETVLVAEVAEEGAEDGAGAELTVDAPWDGYERMTAADIRDRLAAANTTEAGAVELYEATHKARRSVLAAAERAQRR